MKYRPNTTVNKSLFLAEDKFPLIKAWWDQVTLIPDERRTNVFNNGTWKGLNGEIPVGGQVFPTKTSGDSLEWKKAQKKDKKKNTSDTINKTIPQRKPTSTWLECSPCNAPSWEMSRHHCTITNKIIVKPKYINEGEWAWNHLARPDVK